MCRCPPPTPYALAEPISSAPSRCGLSDLPAPGRAAGRDHDDVVPVDQPAGDRGQQGERGRGRVAARARRPAASRRGASRWPGSSGSPYGQEPGVRRAVELLPGRRVGEPEVGPAVDDEHVAGRAPRPPRPRRRAAGRGRRRRGRPASPGVVASTTRSASGVRCGDDVAEARPGAARRGQRTDLDVRVREQQPSSSPPAYPVAPATATLRTMCMSMPSTAKLCAGAPLGLDAGGPRGDDGW